MMRLIAVTVLELAANAIGLLIAAWLLPAFQISPLGFVVVVALFTAAKFILGPLLFKLSFKYVRALNGGVALVTTLAGLWVTTWLTNGLVITGFNTWVLSTLIVWLSGVLATLVLPLFLFKQVLSNNGAPRRPTLPPGLG
ncbi:MAG: phage holin family protein [Rhizobiaceae bacterium]|nr:phage holin family protein [Rhizobiaceae bacterium]